MKPLTVKLPDDLIAALSREAIARGVTVSEFVRQKLGAPDEDPRAENLERRVSRLEELAGL